MLHIDPFIEASLAVLSRYCSVMCVDAKTDINMCCLEDRRSILSDLPLSFITSVNNTVVISDSLLLVSIKSLIKILF